MGRVRIAVVVVVTAGLGLAWLVAGGAHTGDVEVPSAVGVVDHVAADLAEATGAVPEARFDDWSKRAQSLRLPLAIGLTLVLLEAARRPWAPQALRLLGGTDRPAERATSPRAPPA
jgi:hypothetical protein